MLILIILIEKITKTTKPFDNHDDFSKTPLEKSDCRELKSSKVVKQLQKNLRNYTFQDMPLCEF